MKKCKVCLKRIRHKVRRYRKEHPTIYYFLIVYLGGLLFYTAIYLIRFADYSKPMLLNEVGDFLAGVFAPLAFLFLYLGYSQQGKEMQQNTAALKLQAIELKNSVNEQKRLIKIYEDEQNEKHFQVLPFFEKCQPRIKKSTIQAPLEDNDGNVYDSINIDILEVSFKLINYGEVAKNVLVKSKNDEFFVRVQKHKISHEEELKISLQLDEQNIERLEKGEEYNCTLILTYNNIYGKEYTKYINYVIHSFFNPEDERKGFNAKLYINDVIT
ncbi:hypothetical protein ACG9XY_12440 [Acinetobacter seifertii]|uniref:hypothetical protein n=1 Tax=Acinetobacter seifertii TaxID=1530123 RepID=UPI00293FEC08|nr:hypothetical protein [Acinetobacter seifertii]MDV4263329.1 hypothetical protein [Acinetobacter seifertii]